MDNRKLIVAAILLFTCFLAFALTYLLLQSPNIAIMGYVGVLGVAMIFAEPFIGLVNYLLFLYIRPQEFVSGMVGMPIMLLIGIATLGLMIVHMAVKKHSLEFTKAPQNFLMLWFLAAVGVSHLSHLYINAAVSEMQNFVPTLVMYILIVNLVVTQRKLKFVINLLVILTIVLAAQGILQFYTGTAFGGQEMYKGSRIQGIGIFSDPNDLALALVIVLPYLFLKLVERAPGWEKILAGVAMVVLVYALYLTSSRGGMLAFGALMLILFSRKYGVVPGIILGSVLIFAVFVVVPRMMTISTEEASSYGRVEAWGIGLDLFEQYPLFGVGTGSFTEYHFRTAHNSFVLCSAELGLFGLFPWIMLIYLSIKNNHFVSRNTHEAQMDEVTICADTIRYGLIAFVLGAYFLSRTYSELLFVLIGLSVATTRIFTDGCEEKYKLVERKDFVYSFLILVGAWAFTKGFLYFAW